MIVFQSNVYTHITINLGIFSLPFFSPTSIHHPHIYIYMTMEVHHQEEVLLNFHRVEQQNPQGKVYSLFYMKFWSCLITDGSKSFYKPFSLQNIGTWFNSDFENNGTSFQNSGIWKATLCIHNGGMCDLWVLLKPDCGSIFPFCFCLHLEWIWFFCFW